MKVIFLSSRIGKKTDISNIEKYVFKNVTFLRYNFAEIMLYYLLPQNVYRVKFGSAILLFRSLFWESLFEFYANVSLTNKKFAY